MRKFNSYLGFLLVACLFSLIEGSIVLAQESIKIGAIFPLTGPNAAYGQEEKRGIDLAVKRINENGRVLGKRLDVITEDDQFKESLTISALEKLVNRDKVIGIAGGYGSSPGLAFVAAMKNYGLPSSWEGGATIKIDEKYGREPWFFNNHPRAPDYQEVIAKALLSIPRGPKTVAIAYEDSAYGVDNFRFAEKFFAEGGLKVVLSEPFKSRASDYAPLITKVKDVNPDVFYFICYTGDAQLIMKQAKELNYNPKMFLSTVGVALPEFESSLKRDADFVCGIEVWVPDAKYPSSKQYPALFPATDTWVKWYTDAYKREPNYWSILTYVSLVALTNAVNRAGSTEPAKVISAMESTDTMTPMGYLKYFKNAYGSIHQGFKDFIFFQWQKGKKTLLWPKSIQNGSPVYPCPLWDKRP